MKNESLELSNTLKNDVLNIVNGIKNQKSRKRAYVSLIGINTLEKFLDDKNVKTDKSNCCSNNPVLLTEFDVADLKVCNIKLDVRVIVGEEYQQMWIPRNHLIYGFTPDIYVGVKLDSDLNKAEIVNFIEANAVNNSLGNKNYALVESSALKPASALIDVLSSLNVKSKQFLAKDHERAKELFLSYVDNEISNFDKEGLIRHLATCDECKKDFNALYKLNKMFIQASNLSEMAEIFSEPPVLQEQLTTNDEDLLKDTLVTGAAVASTVAAGAVIAAAGAAVAGEAAASINNVMMDKLADEISQDVGILGKLKGLISKREKLKMNSPEIAEKAEDISHLAKEINVTEDIQQVKAADEFNEVISDDSKETLNSDIFEDDNEQIEKSEQNQNLDNKDNNISDEVHNDTEIVQEVTPEPEKLVNDTELLQEITPESKDLVNDAELLQEVIPEPEKLVNDVELLQEVIKEPESLIDSAEVEIPKLHLDLSEGEPLLESGDLQELTLKGEHSLESLNGEVENIYKTVEAPVTKESSYMSNFVRPESVDYNSDYQNDSPPPVEEVEQQVEKEVSEEELQALLQGIDKVEIVGNLKNIDFQVNKGNKSDGSLQDTVINLSIEKREINLVKIAATVLIATSISLAGYAYWKYMVLLSDTKIDPSLFKAQVNNTVPVNNKVASPQNQLKKGEQTKPYVKKIDKMNSEPSNINDDIARALITQGGPVKITNISWEISSSLASNSVFKNYLMVTGQAFKSALSTDLTLATDRATNSMVKVQVILDLQGNIQDCKVQTSSGSNQVDKIVLQTLKNTLNYTKLPSIQTKKKLIKAGLIVNL